MFDPMPRERTDRDAELERLAYEQDREGDDE